VGSLFDQMTAKSDATAVLEAEIGGPVMVNADAQGEAGHDTPRQIKDAGLELLKYGLLEEARKPYLYRSAITRREEIARILEPLDLAMRVDDVRGLAYVVVADSVFESQEDEWSHPLVRRQRLNLEQSLLVAILRQQFVAYELEAGLGAGEAQVALDGLLPHLQAYLGDLGSDAQEKKRLITLLEQLKGHGIVSDVDEHERVTVRPIIAHLANPESLVSLLHAFRAEARCGESGEPAADEEMP
jgi:hypothetical protein